MTEVEFEELVVSLARADHDRRVARHEVAHGLVSELLGQGCASVELTANGGGLAYFRREPGSPWIGVAVALAGRAAELHLLGRVAAGAERDRAMARSAMRRLGLPRAEAKRAVREVEIELSLLFLDPVLRSILQRVGRKLARTRFLDRRGFLNACDAAAAGVFHDEELRRRVRSYCRRVVREAVDHHLIEGSA